MGKARVEIWDRANNTKLADAFTLDPDLYQRNIDNLAPTGAKLNESGGGGIVVQSNHPAQAHIKGGNCVRLHSGSTLVHTFRIREDDRVRVARQHRERTITVDGEDLLDQFRHSLVDPWNADPFRRPVARDRLWNWASPPQTTTSWSTTVHLQTRPAGTRWPKAFPIAPLFAGWVWTRASSGSHPAGDGLFRRPFTLASSADVVFYMAAEDEFEPWIDGANIARSPVKWPDTDGWQDTWRYVPNCSPGDHHFAAKVTTRGGRAAFLAAAFTVVNGKIADPLFSTAGSGWRYLDYPSPKPGFTAVQILTQLLNEAQARWELPGWSIVAHGTHPVIEEFGVRVGTNYRDVIDALAESWIDVAADLEGLTLHVWPKDTRGTVTAVNLDDSVVTLNEVNDAEVVNGAQGVWAEGVRWRYNAASIADLGFVQAESLELGAVTEGSAVHRILDDFLATRAEPLTTLVGEVIDIDGATAGVDYKVGDWVTIGGDLVRCVGMSWTVHPRSGDLIPHPEFESLASLRRREKSRALERRIASFSDPITAALMGADPLVLSGRPASFQWTWSWSDDLEEALNEVDPEKPWQIKTAEKTQRMYLFAAEIDPDDLPDAWGESRFRIRVNGTDYNPLTDVVLSTTVAKHEQLLWGYETVEADDRVQIWCVADGGHVDGSVTLGLADAV